MEQFITVTLPSPITVPVLGGEKTISEIRIHKIIDNLFTKELKAYCDNHPVNILLWEGEEYDNNKNYTFDTISNRVLQIYS